MPDYSFDDRKQFNTSSFQNSSVILVVTRQGHLSEKMMDYALKVASRVESSILVAYVNTMPRFLDGGRRARLFDSAVDKNIVDFKLRALSRNICISHVKESGKISRVIHRLCLIVRKVSFVIIDEGVKLEEAASRAPVPVFSLSGGVESFARGIYRQKHSIPKEGGFNPVSTNINRYYGKMIWHGSLTIALFALFFAHSGEIVRYWSEGGVYAFFPLLTVCVFYYVEKMLLDDVVSVISLRRSRRRELLVSRSREKNEAVSTNGEQGIWKKQDIYARQQDKK